MEQIVLQRVVPDVFADRPESRTSEVWGREVTLRRGEYCLFEAESGAGKSTFCTFLYGLRGDYAGRILFDGAESRTLAPAAWEGLRRRSLSCLFQDLRLFGELTVKENLTLKNDLTGFRRPEEIDRLLEAVGLAPKRNEPVARLSLGQQQRVAFVRSLCQPFDFLLLDEPVSHLDAANGETLARLAVEQARRQGAGVLVTSVGNRLPLPYHKIYRL